MNWKSMIGLSCAVVAAMAALALAAGLRLPADAMLPIHWNAAGEADGFARAGIALALPVLIAAATSAVMTALPRIEPLQKQLSESHVFYRAVWIALLAIFALIEAMVALPAFGLHLPGTLALVGVGALFLVLGNLLPKTRPSFFLGIRTPWTLTDRENWIATHRLGGRTMMAGGLMILAAALVPADIRAGLVIAGIGVAVLPPLLYSYLFWRRAHRAGGA